MTFSENINFTKLHTIPYFQVIRMLIVIVLVFAVCWTPYLTFLVLQGFGVIPIQLDGPLQFAKTGFILMAYMNR